MRCQSCVTVLSCVYSCEGQTKTDSIHGGFYLYKDLDGLGAGRSCGAAHHVLRQDPEAAIVLAGAAVVLRTVQTYVYIDWRALCHCSLPVSACVNVDVMIGAVTMNRASKNVNELCLRSTFFKCFCQPSREIHWCVTADIPVQECIHTVH